MEDFRETNIKEIQKILDNCIAHEYKKKVNALSLRYEYLTQAQLKDYLRQEIFRVTENVVTVQQKYHALRSISLDMDIPNFLWESGFLEDLTTDEKKKYIAFQCSDFNMDAYLQESVCYNEQLPYFSIIIDFVVLSKYLSYLQKQESKYYADIAAVQEPILPKEKDDKTEDKPIKIVGKSNPFKSVLTPKEIRLLTECINEAHIFTTIINM